jgi:D-3-phosphoglycerate dehydrogenase
LECDVKTVLISDPLAPEGVAALEAAGLEAIQRPGLSADKLCQALRGCHALIVRSGTQVTAEVIEAADALEVIGRAGAGLDNIDVDAATRRGIVVMNTPGGNAVSAAELTLAMMLALVRRLPQASQRVKAGEWPRKEFMGTELQGKTLGVIGLGRIGSEVARRALAFGMTVLAYDPFVTEERARRLEVRLVELDELLNASDVITLHTPRSQETQRLIDAAALAKMKDEVFLVNCARGGIVDEAALADAIGSGKVAGAALDVFETEPPANSPLLGFDQVIATPHVGATTQEAQAKVAVQIAEQVADALAGKPPRNAVNAPAVEAELLEVLGPYIELSERLGRCVVQLADERIERLQVTLRGEMTEHDTTPLTTALLNGVLEHALTTPVNFVNAPVLAQERGLRLDTMISSEISDFANLITVEAVTAGGGTSVSGSLFGRRQLRIVRIEDYHVDVIPSGHFLITHHLDRPGVIAHVSRLLAEQNVNIGGMTCGRDEPGGNALLVISTDEPVSEDVVEAVLQSPQVQRAQVISL